MGIALRILLAAAVLGALPAWGTNLYQEGAYRPLAADRRALRVGDVLTVLVVENASAAATANTRTDKSNDSAVQLQTPGRQRGYSLGLAENFDGGGRIARTGRLLAQLSVRVIAVEPNGDLLVHGAQTLTINDETQAIEIEGRVRPIDIAENNSLLSNRIADARITYVGDGVLAESQHKGWLSRVLSFLGLI